MSRNGVEKLINMYFLYTYANSSVILHHFSSLNLSKKLLDKNRARLFLSG